MGRTLIEGTLVERTFVKMVRKCHLNFIVLICVVLMEMIFLLIMGGCGKRKDLSADIGNTTDYDTVANDDTIIKSDAANKPNAISESDATDKPNAIIGPDAMNNPNIIKSNIDLPSVLSFMCMLDNGIIYKNMDGNSLNLYINNINTDGGENSLIGSVDNYYLSMKQCAVDYPFLYFFVAKMSETVPEQSENVLVKLNLETGTLEQIEHADSSLPGICTYYFDGHIITLKNIVTSDVTETYIESYDCGNGEWERHFECGIDNATGKGTAIYGICASADNIYVLYDVCGDKNSVETYLITLDKDYSKVNSIKIDDELHSYELTQFISDMQVFGDYLYIYNASNYGLLARIDNDKLIEIHKGRNFEITPNPLSAQPLFYTRRTNQVFELGANGNLVEKEIKMQNEYTVKTILVSGERCFVVCYADDKADMAYIFDRNKMDMVELPCE